MEVALPVEEVVARFTTCLEVSGAEVEGQILAGCVELSFRREKRHFWSPQLQLQAEPLEAKPTQTRIHGRVGPQPHVWTAFLAVYAVASFVATFALLFAYSQWRLERPMWALWVLGVAAALGGAAYTTAKIGQRLARDETAALLELLHRTVDA